LYWIAEASPPEFRKPEAGGTLTVGFNSDDRVCCAGYSPWGETLLAEESSGLSALPRHGVNTPWRTGPAHAYTSAMNQDLQNFGEDAARLASEKIIGPAMAMAHDAQHAITEQFDSTRKVISRDMACARDNTARCCDRTSAWISANPLTSVGLALLAGMALTTMGRNHHD
jgi:ElaB/YqjD/DUF883 family membrane-anchored ribosome-binding protein